MNKEYFQNLKGEIFIEIPNYEGMYEISTKGRVRNIKSNKITFLKTSARKDGYKGVYLNDDVKVKFFLLHRVLMTTFNPIENPDEMVVNHLDGDKTNNNLDNLEWTTSAENLKHARELGLYKNKSGVDGTTSKLNEFELCLVREALDKGVKQKTLANALAVSQVTISNINNNKHYKG